MQSSNVECLINGIYAAMPEELVCSEFFARLPSYVTAELAGRDRGQETRAMAQHLRQCPECEQVHLALRDTLKAMATQA